MTAQFTAVGFSLFLFCTKIAFGLVARKLNKFIAV
jgi:hypothetical protein